MSVIHFQAKTGEGMKMVKKVPWDVGRDGVVGLVGSVRKRERRRRKNMLFGGPRAVYVHYFMDIRQEALQLSLIHI